MKPLGIRRLLARGSGKTTSDGNKITQTKGGGTDLLCLSGAGPTSARGICWRYWRSLLAILPPTHHPRYQNIALKYDRLCHQVRRSALNIHIFLH